MEKRKFLFTSESVGEGHPDKVCDQISDGVLDCVLKQDPYGRVACETYVTMGLLIVGGEITTTGFVDVHNLTRDILKEIGYDHPKYGFDYHTCAVINTIHTQSPDIAQGVDSGGAGDQGLMVGYACKETPELMPLPIMLAHRLVKKTADVRRAKTLKYLGPDCKSQVTVEYVDGHPKRVDSVVIACQHTEDILDASGLHITKKARQEIIDAVVKPIVKQYIDKDTKYYINQTGKFVVGGPQSDTGMTGRKIVVDTYGGMVASGGGAFSGKDPTKVDRSAAYMTRYVAKNIVAAGIADKCLIHLAYVIGKAEPLSIYVDTYGTGKISDDAIIKLIESNFDLTPKGMIQSLDLLRPIYRKTACYGHFGRTEPEFSWEQTDKAADLKKQAARL
ncbi:MAG: methionine adenosyltransferase [Omnitrophica WOR_2 bacterium RIFOXYB2_FULL_45_11]|nr:MAG: methionine adenosyltransferase [Omnitrophica WOR_2 bacterium RIFOXYA2_FULL_45_12]OGX54455.1 MAG: methionine adenosyltransferase [Omnitrophica WOR_2 bacterium RIFOXYB2_FULL_45_11]HBU07765.1 methionine adenosyltransferase [Candidatus Omnitrophota bacterium]